MKFKTNLALFSETLKNRGIKTCLNLCLNYFIMRLEPDRIRAEPVYLQVEPTVRCNLKCKMCYKRKPCDDLRIEDFVKIVDQMPNLIKVHLQGIGEPFLNKAIFKMIRYAKSKGIKTDLTTNATLIDPAVAEEIVLSGLDYIEFSIDSPTPQTYEGIRPGASLEKVTDNIKRLIERRGNLKNPKMKIVTVVMDENVEEVPEMVGFAHRLGVDSLCLIHVQLWGNDLLKKGYKVNTGFDGKFKEAMLKSEKTAKRLKVYLDLSTPPAGDMTRLCKRPWLSSSVLADGYVVPCCRVVSADEINFGNLLKEPFKDIWNSPKYLSFRRALKSDTRPDACKNCYYYYRDPMSRDHI